jgi:GNAT superfamily N-acetyltransferase
MTFRSLIHAEDLAAVRRLVMTSGFFSEAEVSVAVELLEERCSKGESSGYEFLFAECGDKIIGYTCFGLIPCTQSSYDLYWIVVDPACQGKGVGKALLERSERLIHSQGGRRIYIETSAREQYIGTHAFYSVCGYRQAAFLEDFYAPGDGKLVYCKILETTPSDRLYCCTVTGDNGKPNTQLS